MSCTGPLRATVPLPQEQPETLAPPPPLVSEAGGFPLQFLLPMVGAMSSVVMMVVSRNGQPLFLLIAGVVFVLAVVLGLGFAISSRGRKAAEQASAVATSTTSKPCAATCSSAATVCEAAALAAPRPRGAAGLA